MNDDATTPDAERSGLTRRSVVRAGATAVWTVPVIAVVTAAPAYAMSGNLTLTAPAATRPLIGDTVTATCTIRNTDTSPTNSLRVVVTITPTNPGSYNFAQCTATATGYSVAGPTAIANNGGRFVFTSAAQLAGNNATRAFSASITLPAINGLSSRAGTVTFQALAGGAGTDSTVGTATYT